MNIHRRLLKYFFALLVMAVVHTASAMAADDSKVQIEKAKELYAQAAQMDLTAPKRATVLKDAENILLGVIEKHPKSLDAHRKLMGVYLLSQNYSKAISTMQDAITLSPEDPKLFISLAFLYEHSGSLEFASAMVDQALKLDAENKIANDYKVVLQQKIQMRNTDPHQGKDNMGAKQMPADHGQSMNPHGSSR